jgi:hypothetical protein
MGTRIKSAQDDLGLVPASPQRVILPLGETPPLRGLISGLLSGTVKGWTDAFDKACRGTRSGMTFA